ncbi:hypothetical protein DSM3645_06219 [Blastopirellula marina DSM 3645]|uniref:Uncharacterized protein n=1 Tax=Blastopirellula marina DSM 3645 TaxID=314230 RepID=A4A088_9BACT|nr:hypothetical protein DSM3645_06219 [Blastopirellula marina DSM 3645]
MIAHDIMRKIGVKQKFQLRRIRCEATCQLCLHRDAALYFAALRSAACVWTHPTRWMFLKLWRV